MQSTNAYPHPLSHSIFRPFAERQKKFFRTLRKNPLKNVRCIVKGFQSTFLLFDNGISGNLNTLADGEASGRVREDHLYGAFRIEGRPNKVQSDTHSGQDSTGKLSRHDPVSLQ